MLDSPAVPIALAFFFSGAAALVLQILWTRMLGHVLGATALAVSTVLTVFMGGLALGSHLGGRWAPRLRRPVLAFAALEAGVGLYGLLVPGLLERLPELQQGLGGVLGDGRWGYALLRFLLAVLVLALPTTAMGATLPILAEAVVQRGDDMAQKTGTLYAANTFGAVAGALGAGFWLIPTLGVSATVLLGASIDLAVALGVLLAFGAGGAGMMLRGRAPARTGTARLFELEPELRVPVSSGEKRRALFAFAFSGAAAMTLEVLWTRALGVVLGASTYAFTLILVVFLVGLAGGAAIMSRAVGRIRDPLRVLGRVEIGAGLLTLLAALLIDRLPLWLHDVARDEGLGHLELYASHFVLAAVVILPATLLLGTVLPLVLAVITEPGAAHAGPVVGRAYALNTVGAIAGSFAGGFVVLPVLGVEHGLRAAAGAACAIGVFVLKDRLRFPGGLRAPETALAAGALLLAALGPRWDVERWTAGLFRFYLAREVYTYGWSSSVDVIHHEDGVATTVTVGRYRGRDDGLGVVLKVNGKVDASDVGDMPTQVLSGLLPVLLHDDPEDALVIGYGSGVTPGALLQAPVERLWVAEVESAVYEAANAHFAHVNHRPFEDPRARLVVDDGRNFLLTRDRDFDLIISEPSNPWMSGAASLFTKDFFEIAKRRLRPGGVFLQWLQLYELSPESIHALIRTFHDVFPHVLVFTPDPHSNDTFLVGAREALVVRRDRIERWLEDEKIRAELSRARVEVPEDLVGLFFMGTESIPEVVGPGPINTDDNALIEFHAPLDLLEYATRDARVPFRERARGRRRELVAEGPFEGFPADPEALRFRAYRLIAQGRIDDARDHAEAAEAGGVDVDALGTILHALESPDEEPVVIADDQTRDHEGYARVIAYMMEGRDRDALAALELDDDPRWSSSPAHAFLKAFLLYRRERTYEADALFEQLLEEDAFVAENPAVLYYAGRAAAERHAWGRALESLERFEMASR
jgi:spermidine synthase